MSEIVNGCFTSCFKKRKTNQSQHGKRRKRLKKNSNGSGVGFDDEGGTSTPWLAMKVVN